MTKREIKKRVAHAKNVFATLKGAMLCYNIYADSIYILDTEEDNVIDVVRTEEEAIESCKGINSGEFSDDGKKLHTYYKPVLIDADTGERITRTNLHLYKR
jgi:hypothetical protein